MCFKTLKGVCVHVSVNALAGCRGRASSCLSHARFRRSRQNYSNGDQRLGHFRPHIGQHREFIFGAELRVHQISQTVIGWNAVYRGGEKKARLRKEAGMQLRKKTQDFRGIVRKGRMTAIDFRDFYVRGLDARALHKNEDQLHDVWNAQAAASAR